MYLRIPVYKAAVYMTAYEYVGGNGLASRDPMRQFSAGLPVFRSLSSLPFSQPLMAFNPRAIVFLLGSVKRPHLFRQACSERRAGRDAGSRRVARDPCKLKDECHWCVYGDDNDVVNSK